MENCKASMVKVGRSARGPGTGLLSAHYLFTAGDQRRSDVSSGGLARDVALGRDGYQLGCQGQWLGVKPLKDH